MTKQELIKSTKEIVSQELEGVTVKDTGIFVEATIKAIQDALVAGEKVSLVGFGSFEVVERAARTGRNPQTGAEMPIPASKAPKFKAGKAFKDLLNA